MGYDWILAFYPAVKAFLAGQNPYGMGLRDFLNPPWVLPFLAPFGFLSPELGAWGINLVNLSGLVAFCRKAGRWWMALPLALSFPMGVLLWHAQIEGFLLWGMVIGGPVGFLFLTFKPQVGGGLALLWLWQAWQKQGWKGVVRLTWPTVLLAILFTLLYPNWIGAMFSATEQGSAGAIGGFPWLIPLGVFLLVQGIRTQREELAAPGMLFLSPYARFHSWLISLAIAACQYPLEGVLACAASWVVFGLLAA
ncbi:MAG: hypothetical protein HUU38_12545 [Anaerolineales bacterium]|nr:hypothetical protein [Anaerolineales bacterium]